MQAARPSRTASRPCRASTLSDDAARAGLEKLAQKRLLASNTLTVSNRADRLAWDEANHWLASRLDAPWSIRELSELNAKLTGGSGALRTEPIHSGPDAYLAVTIYISVVTIHPFPNANGRTARLSADRVLLADGALPLCFLSPIASHVAQLQTGIVRDPERAVRLVLAAIAESYTTVL